jgi:hypothetical protein
LEKSTEEEIDNSDNVSEISNLSGLSEESFKLLTYLVLTSTIMIDTLFQ